MDVPLRGGGGGGGGGRPLMANAASNSNTQKNVMICPIHMPILKLVWELISKSSPFSSFYIEVQDTVLKTVFLCGGGGASLTCFGAKSHKFNDFFNVRASLNE